MTSKTNPIENAEQIVVAVCQDDICQIGIASSSQPDDNEDAVGSFGSFYEEEPPAVDCFGVYYPMDL